MRRFDLAGLALLAALAAGCASGGGGTDGGGQQPATSQGAAGQQAGPATNQPWPVKTREHVDTWLHGYALLYDDTTQVPYFRRGYRDQMVVLKNRANVVSQLDANRDRLRARFALNRQLLGTQFLALYFGTWDELGQAVQYFLQSEGDPRRASNPQLQQIIAFMAQNFPSAADRDWLRLFWQGLGDERDKFYRSYWLQQQRERADALTAADTVLHNVVVPRLRRFLNNTQQASGELVLSLPLDGEGRTVAQGNRTNVVAVTFPERAADAAEASYVFVHEVVGNLAASAVEDNITPAQRREGAGDRYQSAAAVRAGLILLERVAPELADGYARYYLRSAGAPEGPTPRAALATAFPIPEAIRDAIVRQLDVVLGGI